MWVLYSAAQSDSLSVFAYAKEERSEEKKNIHKSVQFVMNEMK